MKNLREEFQIELGSLKNTEHLRTKLPLYNVILDPKEDGQRNTFQLGDLGKFFVSRSRHDKTKGSTVAKQPFVVVDQEPWMHEIQVIGTNLLFDGELETLGESTSSEVSKKTTEKQFMVFDMLWSNKDLRNATLRVRRHQAREFVQSLAHPRLQFLEGKEFEIFTEDDLEACLETIKLTRLAGKKCEGFVVKPLDIAPYDHNNYGWKIKREDPNDGFVVAVKEEKVWDHGKQTKTGRVGTVGVAMWFEFPDKSKTATSKIVAWVPLPEEDRCSLKDALDKYRNKTVEFMSYDFTGILYSFPKFVRWRTDKDASLCFWKG